MRFASAIFVSVRFSHVGVFRVRGHVGHVRGFDFLRSLSFFKAVCTAVFHKRKYFRFRGEVGVWFGSRDVVIYRCTPLVYRQDYLAAAAEYLRNTEGATPVEEIKGIWVASDDSSVLGEVQEHWSKYFPNVERDMIVWISGDGGVATHTNRQVLFSRSWPLWYFLSTLQLVVHNAPNIYYVGAVRPIHLVERTYCIYEHGQESIRSMLDLAIVG